MARKSLAATTRCLAAATAALAAGCLTNIPQDKHSGEDFHPKGAKEIELDAPDDGSKADGRAKTDILTYPGGDRVDWKFFQLPEGRNGVVKIKVKWRPPRRGLDLAFRVYDGNFARLQRAKPAPGSGKRSKTVTIENAKGGQKYYVQVFAPRRTDAGEYRVWVRYRATEDKVASAAPVVGADDIPDPPDLAALPEAEEEEEEEEEEEGNAPPPKPCPNDPTKMEPDCPEEPTAEPVNARVVKYQVSSGGDLIVTVDRGKTAGVEAGWTGQVVSSSGRPVQGGTFKVTKVTGGESVGKVRMSVDQIKANRKVVLSPPQ